MSDGEQEEMGVAALPYKQDKQCILHSDVHIPQQQLASARYRYMAHVGDEQDAHRRRTTMLDFDMDGLKACWERWRKV